MKLLLKRVVYPEIHLEIGLPMKQNQKLELKPDFGFRVNFGNEGKTCIAILKQELASHDPGVKCSASVVVHGIFEIDGVSTPEEKKIAHVEAYRALFPFAQNRIAELLQNGGLAPILIQPVNLKPENVSMGDVPGSSGNDNSSKPLLS